MTYAERVRRNYWYIQGSQVAYMQEEAARRAAVEARMEEGPDIIETSSGFSPNYEKLCGRHGMTAEEALVWCNMD